MSKERALLRRVKVLLECSNMEPLQRQSDLIIGEIKELLDQPEQEPVAWKVIDGTNGKYMFSRVKPTERSYKYDVVIPLYTAPLKREPFELEERQRLSKAYSTRAEQVAFEEGIIFAEISYGIVVDDEN